MRKRAPIDTYVLAYMVHLRVSYPTDQDSAGDRSFAVTRPRVSLSTMQLHCVQRKVKHVYTLCDICWTKAAALGDCFVLGMHCLQIFCLSYLLTYLLTHLLFYYDTLST